uniref:Arrestin-like N-terminal domain-containing protein n=1 Tax=Tetraselmis sp. GSL018 TaxID=582737 RepID=A0A061SK25_9CHLO|eukprot:CAMPEP_0177583628 /NCGR_PEP_ID=MMETSP0419_2-20121207/3426_1 /TAXON_ID=582737 /ORGANISM="Tetraselmis sp., Strain GSL018" /LENGTH=577 /DNA_ID=CAMNT_0019073037 /DNA_START=563 /DNA_END=2296 /DNA_ORIENTATION=-
MSPNAIFPSSSSGVRSSKITLRVDLQREIFFPGDTVRGVVTVQLAESLECSSFYVELLGRSSSRNLNQTNHNFSRLDIAKRQRTYAYERKTLWGRVIKTSTILGAGDTAFFGPPWAPREGVVVFPVPDGGQRHIALRVTDEDFGPDSADDNLGEALIDPEELVRSTAESPVGFCTHLLRRGGKAGFGAALLRGSWADSAEGFERELATYQHLCRAGERPLVLTIVECHDLKSSDLFSANDVYCQLHALPSGVKPRLDRPVPSPSRIPHILEPCSLSIPFEFVLPERLPPSIEVSRAFVRYSVYGCLDALRGRSPSAAAHFTVLPAGGPRVPKPIVGRAESEPRGQCCCGMLPSCRTPDGFLGLKVCIAGSEYTPGEAIEVDVAVANGCSRSAAVRAAVVRKFSIAGVLGMSSYSEELCSADGPQVVLPREKQRLSLALRLPPCAPTFRGDEACWAEDVAWLLQHPRGERFAAAEGLKGHPVCWEDSLEVSACIDGSSPEVSHIIPVNVVPPPPEDLAAIRGEEHSGNAVDPQATLLVPDPGGSRDPCHPEHLFREFLSDQRWAPLCAVLALGDRLGG